MTSYRNILRTAGALAAAAALWWSVGAAAAPAVSDIRVVDVTAGGFCVAWPADEPVTGTLEVFDDVLGTTPTASAVVQSQYTASGVAGLGVLAEDIGVLRTCVRGLRADTPYFHRLVTTPKATGVPETFPAAGALFPVRTMAGAFPVSNDSVGTSVTLAGGVLPADGALLVVSVPGTAHPVSQLVGDGYATGFAAVSLANVFDAAGTSNLDLAGGETVAFSVMAGTDGIASGTAVLTADAGRAELVTLAALELSPRLDSDGDGMPDDFELVHQLDPGTDDAGGDPDTDGLTNLEEYRQGTDPNEADSDGDGLDDGDEVATHGTLPNHADTDQDGLDDGQEINAILTDPLDADSDDDGVNDGDEVTAGTGPNDPGDTPVIDRDGDGSGDLVDNCPFIPNPAQTDTDGDALGDACDPDDDGDGVPDGDDNSPLVFNPGQEDGDGDGVGDASDNCLTESNPNQSDNDLDGAGNVCDDDDDNDGIDDFLPPGTPSDTAFNLTAVNAVLETTLPVTSSPAAFLGVVKFEFSTQTQITLGFYNLTTREYVPEVLSPADQARVGGLLLFVDTNSCGCIGYAAGTSVTLDTDAGSITAVLPQRAGAEPAVGYFIADDGSSYTQFFSGTGQLASLAQSALTATPLDNCQFTFNPDQSDVDGDGLGDVCDVSADDLDGDGVLNVADNCPLTHNPDQADNDGDLIGDVCDDDNDNDGLPDIYEVTVTGTSFLDADSDGDGVADGAEDFDFDGRSNAQEYLLGSDPEAPDLELKRGLNLFSYPVGVPGGLSAFGLLGSLGGETVVSRIGRIDPTTGLAQTAQYSGGAPSGVDFPIVGGEGYVLEAVQAFETSFPGAIVCPATDLRQGVNVIGFSCIPQNMSAYQLLDVLGGQGVVASVQRFDTASGRFDTAVFDEGGLAAGVDFPVTNSRAYIANMVMDQGATGFALSPPSLAITSHNQGEVVFASPITVAGAVGDANATVTIGGLSATVTPSGGGAVFSRAGVPLVEGPNALTVFTRGGNNLTTTQTLNITLATPPAVTVTAPVDARVVYGELQRVTGTVSDPAAVVDVNGVPAAVNGNEFSANILLSEGANTITITATGANTAVTTVTREVTYVPVAVTVTIGSSSSDSRDLVVDPSLFALTGGSRAWSLIGKPAFIDYADDGVSLTAPDTIALDFTITPLGVPLPGTYSFTARYTFRDGATNPVFTEDIDFQVTIEALAGPPVVTIDSHSDGQTVNASPIVVSGTVTDAAASVTVNGLAASVNGNSYSASVALAEGPNAITVIASNGFGSDTRTINVTLDTVTVTPDVTVSVGGSGAGNHTYAESPANIAQIAFFNFSVSGLAGTLTYNNVGVTIIGGTQISIDYSIAAGAGAVPGLYTADVTYNFLDAGLATVSSEAFQILIEVVP